MMHREMSAALPRWRLPSACPPSCYSSDSSFSVDARPSPTKPSSRLQQMPSRSASIARTRSEAQEDAQDAARASLANQEHPLPQRQRHRRTGDFAKPVGEPGTVAVTVQCRVDLSDLSVPGVPGSRDHQGDHVQPLDTWRERG